MTDEILIIGPYPDEHCTIERRTPDLDQAFAEADMNRTFSNLADADAAARRLWGAIRAPILIRVEKPPHSGDKR